MHNDSGEYITFKFNGQSFRFIGNVWTDERGVRVPTIDAQKIMSAYTEQYGPIIKNPQKKRGRKKRSW